MEHDNLDEDEIDDEAKIRAELLIHGPYGLNVEQIVQRVFPDEYEEAVEDKKTLRTLKDRVRRLLKKDPLINFRGSTRSRYFYFDKSLFNEEIKRNLSETIDSFYISAELTYQGQSNQPNDYFRGNDFWLNLKKLEKETYDFYYNEETGQVNDRAIDSAFWNQATKHLLEGWHVRMDNGEQTKLMKNKQIHYNTNYWIEIPNWMSMKKITLEIPKSIDIILEEIKALLDASVGEREVDEYMVRELNIKANNPIYTELEHAMEFDLLSREKLSRSQVIKFALLHFYRTLKSDQKIKLPNGYEAFQD
tara:strand:- start:51 stop:965 length:915 start_codon:yes stop_codon:yes gene_type:complete